VVFFRVHRDELSAPAGERDDRLEELAADDPLAVVLDDDRVRLITPLRDRADEPLHRARRQRLLLLAVHADDLLVVGDDARLDDGGARGRHDPAHLDLPRGELPAQHVAPAVLAGQADDGHPAAERADIARDVGGTPRHHRLRLDPHDGDRRFGADAADLAPHELIEHEVADHQHARLAEAAHQLRRRAR
jgi:hypothetical protein